MEIAAYIIGFLTLAAFLYFMWIDTSVNL